MSLYDDIDTEIDKKADDDSNISGWATGIKLYQSHQQLKKATVTQPKREESRKQLPLSLAPIVNLKAKAKSENAEQSTTSSSTVPAISPFIGVPSIIPYSLKHQPKDKKRTKQFSTFSSIDPNWQFENEYDPSFPNEYEKALRELRERREKEAEEEETKRRAETEKEEEEVVSSTNPASRTRVEIAPPPSLSAPAEAKEAGSGPGAIQPVKFGTGGSSAAARIMAKYGYKEGQGLGKKEQGMSTALQVEKTSFRTGRIIHEKDALKDIQQLSGIPNPMGLASSMAAYNDEEDEVQRNVDNDEPTITDLLKNPSKVILLKNMVGPGEVDDELEPEVKEECQGKYGEVSTVMVYQMPDMEGEDPIRIFVEFKKVESAAKALLDLNGRFFGGRQVKASFYDYEKFTNLELTH